MYTTGGGLTVVARLCVAAALITYGNFKGWPGWAIHWAVPLAAIAIIIGPLRLLAGVGKLFSFYKNLSNKNT